MNEITERKPQKLALKIGIELITIIIGITGMIDVIAGGGVEPFSLRRLLYFTMQSNLAIMLLTVVFLCLHLRQLVTGRGSIPPSLLLLKYIFVVAIAVTLLAYWIIIAPNMRPMYVFTYASFSVHLFVPLLAIAEFYLWDYEVNLSRKKWLLGLLPMLCYLAFAMIASVSGVKFSAGYHVPYVFLDYKKLTWFSLEHGLGVFYAIMILLVMCVILTALMSYFVKKRACHAAKHAADASAQPDPVA
ncbi:MAG: hypothetical protein RSD46_05325 [Oscillospiraceae bacterium]